MTHAINSDYSKALRTRIEKLMSLSDLEIPGFAEFTGVSESHLYAILNGNRELTGEIARKIVSQFNLEEWQLFKLDYKLTKKVLNYENLNKFYDENKGVYAYYISKREKRKIAYFIEQKLLNSKLFNSPVCVSKVREACEEAGEKLSSKRVSQILKYLVEREILQSEKRPIRLKDGSYGNRIVDVYYKKSKS